MQLNCADATEFFRIPNTRIASSGTACRQYELGGRLIRKEVSTVSLDANTCARQLIRAERQPMIHPKDR